MKSHKLTLIKNLVLSLILTIISASAIAGSWSSIAVPTRVDIERGNGFMIHGNFGNPGNCSHSNKIFVLNTHPQYDKLYATALAAFTAGKKLQIFVRTCSAVSWYAVPEETFNTLTPNDAMNIMN